MPHVPAKRRRGRSLAIVVAPTFVYAAVAVVLFWPVWLSVRHVWIGLGSDTDLLIWSLRWTPYALSHGINPFFTTHLNYPTGVNLAWNPLMPVVGIVMWPVVQLAGPVAAYNVTVAGGMVLAGTAAFAMIRRFVAWWPAALLGGLVYGFSPYMTAQAISHGNLVLVASLPVLGLLIHDVAVRQVRSPLLDGLLVGVVLAVQFLAFQEVAATAVVVGAVGLAILAAARPALVRRKLPYAVRALGVSALVFVVLAGFPIYEQFFGPQHIVGAVHSDDANVTDLLNLIVPTPALAIAPGRATAIAATFTGNVTEWDGYLGVPLLVTCVVIVVAFWKELWVRVMGLTALVVLILSFGPHLHVGGRSIGIPLPWAPLGALPGLNSVLPGRMAVYVDLFAALLLAKAVAAVRAGRFRSRFARAAAALLLAAVCTVPLIPRLPYPTTASTVPPFFAAGAPGITAGSAWLVAPFPATCPFDPEHQGPPCSDSDPMVWQAVTGMRFAMPGGYFVGVDEHEHTFYGSLPTVTSTVLQRIERGDTAVPPGYTSGTVAAAIRGELHRWHIAGVVVGPMPHHDDVIAFLSSVLGRLPTPRMGADLWSFRSSNP